MPCCVSISVHHSRHTLDKPFTYTYNLRTHSHHDFHMLNSNPAHQSRYVPSVVTQVRAKVLSALPDKVRDHLFLSSQPQTPPAYVAGTYIKRFIVLYFFLT